LDRDLPKEIGELKVLYLKKERQEDRSMKKETADVLIAPCKPEMFNGSEEELAKYPWDILQEA